MKISIIEHSGEVHVTEVESFDSVETFKQLKEAQNIGKNEYMVLIGDIIIDSRSVKSVSSLKE
ncbi:hypothetical protein ACNRWW_14005 [Metabacillus sp. HB246100]